MKKHLSTIFLVLVLLAGLSLLLYPTVSDYWNSMHQSRAIVTYDDSVANLTTADYNDVWQAATDYNWDMKWRGNRFVLDDEERETYETMLNVAGNGVMGYVEVPKIECRLPIYHGTNEAVLQVAIGHIEGTSLPVGGLGTHCVVSGHRGLPSARLFTDLDQVTVGDTVLIHVLDETLTYLVDQILIVEPHDTSALAIDPACDYLTLVTCTPYGINSHRLLVRGHRIETEAGPVHVTVRDDATLVDEWVVMPFVAVPVVVVLLLYMLLFTGKKKEG